MTFKYIAQYWKQGKTTILNNCDPEIRKVIADLNDNGYYTIDSCSGHKKDPEKWYREKGQIYISAHAAKNEKGIINIMRKNGLKNIRKVASISPDLIVYEFSPVGKGYSQAHYNMPIRKDGKR